MTDPLVRAEIDLAAYRRNLQSLRALVRPQTKLMAVVKADAYGHGAVDLSLAAIEGRSDFLGVARIDEALELREAGIEAPILIFGHTPLSLADVLIDYELTQTIYSLEAATALSSRATDRRCRISVHLKVDTGMGRLGLLPASSEAISVATAIATLPGLALDGVYTHFASADIQDKTSANEQLDLFLGFVETLRRNGVEIPLRHAANSAATIDMPDSHLDMVRLGISTYGLLPSPNVATDRVALEPVMRLSARIMQLKELPTGSPVSYGGTWQTPKPTTIATVAVGYADGLSRLLSSRGEMLVRGQRAPIVGRVCMDLTMLDVGHIEGVTVDDEVVIIGTQGDETILASELAALSATIPYEVLTSITKRVPRVYRS
jgi:alanine racemase